MSHYTIGVGSRPDLQRYARRADRARSAASKHVLGLLAERIRKAWRGAPPTGMAPLHR